jgi:hypothetical protein
MKVLDHGRIKPVTFGLPIFTAKGHRFNQYYAFSALLDNYIFMWPIVASKACKSHCLLASVTGGNLL